MRWFLVALAIVGSIVIAAGCSTDAQVASHNLSMDADQFKIDRRVVFFNGITDTYLLTIEGRCSITADVDDSQLEVTCRVNDDAYKKHFLGLSDNVSYFVEQLEYSDVDTYRYKVIFKPQSIIPDFDLSKGSDGD
jgi:hypothetical protein